MENRDDHAINKETRCVLSEMKRQMKRLDQLQNRRNQELSQMIGDGADHAEFRASTERLQRGLEAMRRSFAHLSSFGHHCTALKPKKRRLVEVEVEIEIIEEDGYEESSSDDEFQEEEEDQDQDEEEDQRSTVTSESGEEADHQEINGDDQEAEEEDGEDEIPADIDGVGIDILARHFRRLKTK